MANMLFDALIDTLQLQITHVRWTKSREKDTDILENNFSWCIKIKNK